MNVLAVSYHTPEMKQLPKTGEKKALAGPIKAKVHVTLTKERVLTFFCNKGLIYIKFMPRGAMVSANYILEALGKFVKTFSQKRPIKAAGECFFYWNNSFVHTTAVVTTRITARWFQV